MTTAPLDSKTSRLGLATALLLSTLACEDSARVIDASGGAEPPDETLEPTPAPDPLYAITGTTFGPEGNSSYVALVPSLERDTEIDYGSVLEVAGGASIFGLDGQRFFAVGYDDQPAITRFDIDEQNRFVERESVSLQGYGLDSMWRDPGLVPILSDTKAYIVDSDTRSVVVWDPASMLVSGSFALDGVADAAYPDLAFEPDPTRRGDELLIVATHQSETATAPFSTLIVLDTANDRVASVVREERCGGLWSSVQVANGDTYFATGPWDAAQNHALGAAVAGPPCVVRVKAGESVFDPEYFVTASELTLGRATGGLVSGPNDTAYVKALEESQLPAGADFDAVWGGAAWHWWQVDLAAATPATLVEDLPSSSAGGGELVVQGRAYALNVAADFATTTLVDMGGEAGPSEQLTVRGWPYGIVRVR